MRLDMQVRLLRVLQEKEVLPLGGCKAKKVDIRVVAATNSDLEDMVKAESFRADLYYRLNVVVIDVPPLRDRLEDIPVIADHFMQDFSLKHQKQIPHLLSNTLHMLQSYGWPGNVRELRNIVERMILFNEKETISPEDVKEVFPIDFKQVKDTARTGLRSEERRVGK